MADGQWYENATSVQVRQWATIVTIGVGSFVLIVALAGGRAWPVLAICGGLCCGGLWLLWLWKRREERHDEAWRKEKYGPKGRP